MSTIVQMPVRVKPPEDMGEIISPGWAFLEVTMPPKGARITVSCPFRFCNRPTVSSTRRPVQPI